MNPALAADLREWKTIFRGELSEQLSQLREDKDIYGFALEVPEDLSNLSLSTVVGRESKLVGEKPGSAVWIDRRYSPVEWGDYLPNARVLRGTHAGLERIAEDHRSSLVGDSDEDTEEQSEFRKALYAACLDAMAECDAAGEFGQIWFKIIFMSDGEHPVIRESFLRLNEGRGLKEAAVLYANG